MKNAKSNIGMAWSSANLSGLLLLACQIGLTARISHSRHLHWFPSRCQSSEVGRTDLESATCRTNCFGVLVSMCSWSELSLRNMVSDQVDAHHRRRQAPRTCCSRRNGLDPCPLRRLYLQRRSYAHSRPLRVGADSICLVRNS